MVKVHRFFFYILALMTAVLLLGSCDNLLGSDNDDDDDDDSSSYSTSTAAVDYLGDNLSIFFDFSTGTLTAVDHDMWDVAIATDGAIIANSGDYGSGVTVYKTSSTDISDDLSSYESKVAEYTFKSGTTLYGDQTETNPFDDEIGSGGSGSGTVYLVKDEAGIYYKLVFTSYGPMGQYSVNAVEGLSGTSTETISGTIDAAYGYTYFDLGTQAAVTVAPKKSEWDILFTRTNDILDDGSGGAYIAGRSDVLLNTAGGVEGATVDDTAIEAVVNISDYTFSSVIDTLGYSWYTHNHSATPAYSVNTLTYVVETTEGNYAKLQPGSFYGPNSEQFYMTFRYYYQADGSTDFSR